jgi:CO/xanthine dehydrogenase Mo-binding subunit
MSAKGEMKIDVFGATLTRRGFVKGSGALVVGLSVPAAFTVGSAGGATVPSGRTIVDPSKSSAWIEIHADNTFVVRTGLAEFGQGSGSAATAQTVAEELKIPYSAIKTVIMGDTDATPDGGTSAGFLMKRPGETQPEIFGGGMLRLMRAAAYTREALLTLASTNLGVPRASLSVNNGVVSGGGRSVTYGQLVAGQALELTIPTTGTKHTGLTVTGNPPVTPPSQYKVLGTDQPMKVIPGIVNGSESFVADIRLPGMLHGRIVRPATVGSTLVKLGKLNKRAYPTTQVVVKGQLVGVLSPNEWEAVGAAQALQATTKWTSWAGLPASGNLPKALRDAQYSHVPMTRGGRDPVTGQNNAKGDPEAVIKTAAKTLSSTYFVPYIKHGPIGPSITLADVRSDGTVHLWVHSQNAQATRVKMAHMLGKPVDDVVVHWAVGAGHYGRSNGGIDGSEADAVILSQAVQKPVRVTWDRREDFQWATQQMAMLLDVKVGLDANGNMIAFNADYYGMGTQDDRPSGALLAGLPAHGSPAPIVTGVSNEFHYNKIQHVVEKGHGSDQLGETTSPNKIGLRAHSFRTPTHRQETYAAETMMNEAAAVAKVDPIEYRLRHTTDQRLITVLETLRKEHGWQTRPSPKPDAKTSGTGSVTGQGVFVFARFNAWWAAAADISVNLKTGKIKVVKYTGVIEPGLVVNPRQLRLNYEGGTVQGISEALQERTTFDRGKVTSIDWVTYPIMRMVDMPDLKNFKFITIDRRDLNVAGMGAEASNALPPGAIAAALFDATGKWARATPMTPKFVRNLLKT